MLPVSEKNHAVCCCSYENFVMWEKVFDKLYQNFHSKRSVTTAKMWSVWISARTDCDQSI